MREKLQAGVAFGWRSLGSAAALGLLALSLAGVLMFGPDPFIVAFLVVFAVVLGLLQTAGRAGPFALLVVSVLVLVLLAPYSAEDLAHPESWRSFLLTLGMFFGAATGILAALATLRRWKPGPARPVGVVALGLLGAGLVLAGTAATSVDDDAMVPGDVVVAALDVAFTPATVSVPAEGAGIFVENRDPVRHTFTVPALAIDVELPASTSRRVQLDAAPGVYEVVCRVPGHESMKLLLQIEG